MITIILLFSIAAGFRATLLIPILQDKSPSRPFVFIHGGIAATALVMLLLRFFKESASVSSISVVLFVIAAIGGLVLFARDMQNKSLLKGWLYTCRSSRGCTPNFIVFGAVIPLVRQNS